MKSHCYLIAALAGVMVAPALAARISINAPDPVPAGLAAADSTRLAAARVVLVADYSRTNAMISAQSSECRQVELGSDAATNCIAKAKRVRAAVAAYREALSTFQDEVVVADMGAVVSGLDWTAAERARALAALSALGADGDPSSTIEDIRKAWHDVLQRIDDPAFVAEAGHGAGPGFPDAGTQAFQDCTIFAMANATGELYDVVAARATTLIEKGSWRNAADRAHPQQVIEREGLMGGEVVLLAEAMGQVEVVPSERFASTLANGSQVMIAVVPQDGDVAMGHEIVLTRSFQHDGTSWFEAIDSNQGPMQHLFLSKRELDTILQERGVVSRPEPGTVTRLLR
jgi:hypothetical protein